MLIFGCCIAKNTFNSSHFQWKKTVLLSTLFYAQWVTGYLLLASGSCVLPGCLRVLTFQFLESNCPTNERPVIRGKEVLCAHLSSVVLCAELVLDIVVVERSLRDAGDRHCGLLLRPHWLSCNAQHDNKFNSASTQGRFLKKKPSTDLRACSSADLHICWNLGSQDYCRLIMPNEINVAQVDTQILMLLIANVFVSGSIHKLKDQYLH